MRVVHAVYSFGTGGLEKGIAMLVNGASPGIEHVVLCMHQSGDSENLLPPGTKVLGLGKPAGNSIRFLAKLRGAVRELAPDVVHTRNWGGVDAIVAARAAGVPTVVHGEHGWGMDDPDGASPKRRLTRRLLSPLVTEFTCVSKQIEGWLRGQVGPRKRITQIYNGVDASKYRPRSGARVALAEVGIPEDAPVAVIVGRLDPIKDHPTLFSALAEVRRELPDARLLVVGDGPERARLAGLAGPGVHLLGNRHDVSALVAESDLFVLSSLNEGISNTILEAMACAVPVVATRVGGNPELVEDGLTGRLVPARDVVALASAMLAYLGDRETARAHGRRGRLRVEDEFSIAAMVRGYEQVYRRPRGAERALRSAKVNG